MSKNRSAAACRRRCSRFGSRRAHTIRRPSMPQLCASSPRRLRITCFCSRRILHIALGVCVRGGVATGKVQQVVYGTFHEACVSWRWCEGRPLPDPLMFWTTGVICATVTTTYCRMDVPRVPPWTNFRTIYYFVLTLRVAIFRQPVACSVTLQ